MPGFKKVDAKGWLGEIKDQEKKSKSKKGGKQIFSRPSMRIENGDTFLKLFPDPDANNKKPYFDVEGHYINKQLCKCVGAKCKKHPGLYCAKEQKVWDSGLSDLYEQMYPNCTLNEDEKKLYFEQKKIADKTYKKSEYDFYYVADVTPAINDEMQAVDFKSCHGKRGERDANDKECLGCSWQTQCQEGLKIYQVRWGDKNGSTNGEKIRKCFSNTKRVEAVFNCYPDDDGDVRTRIVKISRGGAKEFAQYEMSLLDDDFLIPSHVMDFWCEQMTPLVEAVLPGIDIPMEKQIELGIEAEDSDGFDTEKMVETVAKKEPEFAEESSEGNFDAGPVEEVEVEVEEPEEDLADHPNEAIREMAAKKKPAKKDTKKKPTKKYKNFKEQAKDLGHKIPGCLGDAEVFERGEGPCVICEKRHPYILEACAKKVEMAADMMAAEVAE